MRPAVVGALVILLASSAASADDSFAGASVIFARGSQLVRTDPRGKGEAVVATLADKTPVRALRTDAHGKILIADVGGSWQWMKLDGSATTLSPLPCGDGPAQLAEDGACVLCRAQTGAGSVIVNLFTGKTRAVDIPAPGTRLTGEGANRRLVWADASGVWSSPPGDLRKKVKVAAEPPLRSFLPSPNGQRGVGVYTDVEHEGKQTKPAEFLMGFALDGEAARRKGIQTGVPLEWAHDGSYVLVQDGASACLMKAMGGQYKCWKGYTAASISSDGKYGLVFGNRDGGKKPAKAKDTKKSKSKGKKPKDEPTEEAENATPDDASGDDVSIAPPTGTQALYRAELEGAFTVTPALITRVVDGAAVWVPAAN